MSCNCAEYGPIELDRKSITRRIRQSRAIRKRLALVADHEGLGVSLLRCADCGQFWQSGHEWNFADREYLFHVPMVEVEDWQREPYRQPASMMIYSAVMSDFIERSAFEDSDSPCRSEACAKQAVSGSVYCLEHHIRSLRELGMLPQPPVGRIFPPYYEG
jgi:hypothetical protein